MTPLSIDSTITALVAPVWRVFLVFSNWTTSAPSPGLTCPWRIASPNPTSSSCCSVILTGCLTEFAEQDEPTERTEVNPAAKAKPVKSFFTITSSSAFFSLVGATYLRTSLQTQSTCRTEHLGRVVRLMSFALTSRDLSIAVCCYGKQNQDVNRS